MSPAQSTVCLTSRRVMLGRIVSSCRSIGIPTSIRIMVTIMGRPAGQDQVHRGPALVEAALIHVIKARIVKVDISNSLVRATSNRVISQDTE